MDFEKSKLEELQKKVKWTLHKANLPALSDNIKKRERDQLERKETKLRNTILAIDAATKEESGDFKEVRREISATRSATNPPFSKLKHSVVEAEKELDPAAAAIVKNKMEEYEANLINEKKKKYVEELVNKKMDEADTEIMTQVIPQAEVEHQV